MQESNPYTPPSSQSISQGPSIADLNHLLGIAKAQRGLMLGILGYLASIVLVFVLGMNSEGSAAIPGLLMLISGLFALVFLIVLTYRMSGVIFAIIIGICSLIPFVGILVMLVISGRASKKLKQAGFKIGLLGADITQIKKAIEAS